MEHAGFGSRFFAWLIDLILMGILAGLCAGCAFGASTLAAVGDDSLIGWLFGLSAFMAQQRTKEIGIRKVMGASINNILSLLTINFSWLVVLANLIAWPLSWWLLTKWLQNFSYHTNISLWIFPLAGILALVIAIMTTTWQAYSAANTNPAETLKFE